MHGSTLRQNTSWIVVTLSASYLLLSFNIKTIFEKSIFKDPANAEAVSNILTLVAVGLFMSVAGLGLGQWQMNRMANENAADLVARANHRSLKNHLVSSDPSEVPSTNKISPSTLASYQVAPDQARYLVIPKLNVDARVLSVGVNTKGALETPSNVFDTAWYNASALPGQPGATLIDGHISSWTAHGVFYGLNQLQTGDILKIVRGDGVTISYGVQKTQVYDASNVDMNAVLSPIDSSKSGLNLISCSGSVVAGSNEFNKRIVIFASKM